MPPLPPSAAIFHLGLVDYSILAVYIAVVIGVGFALHGKIRNAGDFLLSGRSVPSGSPASPSSRRTSARRR